MQEIFTTWIYFLNFKFPYTHYTHLHIHTHAHMQTHKFTHTSNLPTLCGSSWHKTAIEVATPPVTLVPKAAPIAMPSRNVCIASPTKIIARRESFRPIWRKRRNIEKCKVMIQNEWYLKARNVIQNPENWILPFIRPNNELSNTVYLLFKFSVLSKYKDENKIFKSTHSPVTWEWPWWEWPWWPTWYSCKTMLKLELFCRRTFGLPDDGVSRIRESSLPCNGIKINWKSFD